MVKLRRLNMDSSWAISWEGTSMLIDPWLLGSGVDGYSWFNEQWHVTPPVAIKSLDQYQSILISQSYPDHCHKQTLEALEAVPYIVTPSALKRIKREMPGREVCILPELSSGNWLLEGSLHLAYLDPGRMIDPIFNGIIIRHDRQAIVYFPHGFTLQAKQLDILRQYDILVVMTSFASFKLPFFLGGAVNPGIENALALVNALNPRKVVHTHDENKHAKGLVKKIAKLNYPTPEQLQATMADRFVYVQYDPLEI